MTTQIGSEQERRASTYGDSGWRPRTDTHLDDLIAGKLWHRCGTTSETDRLREVVLAKPILPEVDSEDPNEHLMLDWPDWDKLAVQAESIAAFYRSQDIKVYWADSVEPPPPNYLFQRDLFFSTPEGVIISRPAAQQRSAEPRLVARMLASIGVPILATPRGEAFFEGADALWLDDRTLMVGVGFRTNQDGLRLVEGLLNDMGYKVVAIPLPVGVQHLLGVVNRINPELAVVHGGKINTPLRTALQTHGIKVIELPDEKELAEGMALNFVTLESNKVVMPANCPLSRARLEALGVEVFELDISEYRKGAGGLGCLTGILLRAAARPT